MAQEISILNLVFNIQDVTELLISLRRSTLKSLEPAVNTFSIKNYCYQRRERIIGQRNAATNRYVYVMIITVDCTIFPTG